MAGRPFAEIGLDKSVPYSGVLMEKPDIADIPVYTLPAGYRFTRYRPGLERDWARIETAVEEFGSEEEATAYFAREFLPRASLLPDRMVFVCDAAEQPVGTASIWPGGVLGGARQRVHWVAVAPEHQNRGLSKALLTQVLSIYRALGCGEPVYLASQTWSYKALHVYAAFGFQPYRGPRPDGWQPAGDETAFRQEQERAWDIIRTKWRECGYEA